MNTAWGKIGEAFTNPHAPVFVGPGLRRDDSCSGNRRQRCPSPDISLSASGHSPTSVIVRLSRMPVARFLQQAPEKRREGDLRETGSLGGSRGGGAGVGRPGDGPDRGGGWPHRL